MEQILHQLFQDLAVRKYIFWYYTPMALPFSRHLEPMLTVYDCMDELSAFKFAPPALLELERELLSKATLVFTGGRVYMSIKKQASVPVYCFPSSIDKNHFNKARLLQSDTDDQFNIPFPRFGFFGVIDERFDIDLIDSVARQKPDWQFVLIGPVVKIDEVMLPRRNNIHYLGAKSMTSCRPISAAGMWPYYPLPLMNPPVLSALLKHPNTWQPESRLLLRLFRM